MILFVIIMAEGIPMKKVLSALMAVVLMLSVFSGLGIAYAGGTDSNKKIDLSVTSFDLTANAKGCGAWQKDAKENYYFNYFLSFNLGDTLTVTDNSDSTVYTYSAVKNGEYTSYEFLNSADEALNYYIEDNQYKNHWSAGSYTATLVLPDYNLSVDIPVNIAKGSQNTCLHKGGNWKTVNSYPQNYCIACGKLITKLNFEDLGSFEYYYDYVAYTSYYNNFITGTNPTYYTDFSPKTRLTRAMLITVIYRMAGSPYDVKNPYSSNPFKDIKTNSYYYNAACWALKNNITNQLTFRPNNYVTREQTASFLFRYAKLSDCVDDGYKSVDLTTFPDYKNVSSWAVESMQWAYENNMITGSQQGTLNPQYATQRIHASKILYGFGAVCNIGNFENSEVNQ